MRRPPDDERHGNRPVIHWGIAGGLVLAGALIGPIPAAAHEHFWVHMVQHLLVMLVAAPLILLSAPVTRVLRATRGRMRFRVAGLLRSRPFQVVSHPLVTWGSFALVMWVTHFSPIYQLAVENELVHLAEHSAYLVAALLFWTPVIGLDPARHKLSWPVRIAYLLLALPLQSFLGLALYSSERPLYAAYPSLDDQRLGALIMWIGGDLLFVVAIALAVGGWMRADTREAERIDKALGV